MAELKTKVADGGVDAFLAAVEPAAKHADAQVLDALFQRVTGQPARLWGPSIVGYGRYAYQYDSGHGGEMCRVGFSPRKAKHSLYVLPACTDPDAHARADAILARLGKHARSKACIYINKLADVDMAVLEELVRHGWDEMARLYPE